METMEEILEELRSGEFAPLAYRIEAAHKREQEDAIAATVVAAAKSASEVYEPHIQSKPVGDAAGKQSVTDCNQHETVDIESRCIYGEVKDAEPASQTMDKWAYPLTNVCKCGNGQEPKPCATVKDANGVVLLHFNGIPWRSNKDSTAMATEFCERMNAQGNKPVGNAAKMREALHSLVDVIERLDGNNPLWWHNNALGVKALKTAKTALAEPLRNCDVGTAEEQEERYIKLKREHVDRLLRCPAEGHSFFPDSLYWAQMPYESEVK
jgi:hypothetical protein